MISLAKDNARKAGVDDLIKFSVADARKPFGAAGSLIVTNPPYGERLMDKSEVGDLYRVLGERYKMLDSWSMYIISSYEKAESDIGRKADKNRKIYNGMMKTYFYEFRGPKPPSRKKD